MGHQNIQLICSWFSPFCHILKSIVAHQSERLPTLALSLQLHNGPSVVTDPVKIFVVDSFVSECLWNVKFLKDFREVLQLNYWLNNCHPFKLQTFSKEYRCGSLSCAIIPPSLQGSTVVATCLLPVSLQLWPKHQITQFNNFTQLNLVRL